MLFDELLPVIDGDTLRLTINLTIYPQTVVFKTCYVFTDRAYFYLQPGEYKDTIYVYFRSKTDGPIPPPVAGEFMNELINQQLRYDIAVETGPIRQLLVAQAFAEIRNQDSSVDEKSNIDNYYQDPFGIGK